MSDPSSATTANFHSALDEFEAAWDPLNLWRIVILTPEPDERYTEPFKEMAREGLLPGFLEIYIERKFHCDLERRAA